MGNRHGKPVRRTSPDGRHSPVQLPYVLTIEGVSKNRMHAMIINTNHTFFDIFIWLKRRRVERYTDFAALGLVFLPEERDGGCVREKNVMTNTIIKHFEVLTCEHVSFLL